MDVSAMSFQEKFDSKLIEYEQQHQGSQRKPWTTEKILEVMNNIRKARVSMSPKQSRTAMDYYWISKYDIMVIANEDYLIFKRNSPNDPTALPKKGIVTQPIVTQDFNIRGQVYLMDFQSFPDDCDDFQKRKRSPSPVLSTSLNTSQIFKTKQQQLNESSPPKKFKIDTTEAGPSKSPNIDTKFTVPLAKQVQPKTLDDFFGQNHVLGPGTMLRSLLEKGEIPNMILWGPPGCGKTSLAGVIQGMCQEDPKKLKFVSLCAATAGVKDVQNVVASAKTQLQFGRRTVLFMDEIHRFNKKQQDIFLLHVEKGDIILVGATTENPSFTINNALLSRCRVIVLEKLEPESLYSILEKAAHTHNVEIIDENSRALSKNRCGVERNALEWLADISDGDARIALGNLQLVLQFNENNITTIDDIKDKIKKSHMLYDRKGEEHYNIISAMHKSIRGSDVNAALYWTTRMIVSGEDPLFIARRMVRAASEDIGNADPRALQLAVATMQGCQLIGMPEADVLLAQCAIYLARAPKSREADSALAKAKKLINNCKGSQPAVPLHIRNAPTRLMKDLGYGKQCGSEKLSFMPPELDGVNFFK